MQKTKCAPFFLSLFLVIGLSGCGLNVVAPDDNQTTSVDSDNAVTEERTCSIVEYDQCLAAVKVVNNDLNTCMQNSQKCNDSLQAFKTKAENEKVEDPKLNEILKSYTTTTEQKEYAFDSCGKVSGFTAQPWFADFSTALEESQVSFVKSGRNLIADDFTGGCSSTEGGIAFFMGAETQSFNEVTGSGADFGESADVFEFHLVKYHIPSKSLAEVIMPSGLCTDETCPAIFLTREGAYIPMSGISEDEECFYKYFYDQNILVKDICNEK